MKVSSVVADGPVKVTLCTGGIFWSVYGLVKVTFAHRGHFWNVYGLVRVDLLVNGCTSVAERSCNE